MLHHHNRKYDRKLKLCCVRFPENLPAEGIELTLILRIDFGGLEREKRCRDEAYR